MLLPMPENAAREIFLVNHLTFAAWQRGAGSAYLFNELIRVIYLAYYVQDAGFGDADLIIYARAEAAMECVLQRAERSRAWTLDAHDIPLFEAVLRQSDRRLANAPRHVHLGARPARLFRVQRAILSPARGGHRPLSRPCGCLPRQETNFYRTYQ